MFSVTGFNHIYITALSGLFKHNMQWHSHIKLHVSSSVISYLIFTKCVQAANRRTEMRHWPAPVSQWTVRLVAAGFLRRRRSGTVPEHKSVWQTKSVLCPETASAWSVGNCGIMNPKPPGHSREPAGCRQTSRSRPRRRFPACQRQRKAGQTPGPTWELGGKRCFM